MHLIKLSYTYKSKSDRNTRINGQISQHFFLNSWKAKQQKILSIYLDNVIYNLDLMDKCKILSVTMNEYPFF